jgi:predicted nucleic acid-binding protein
VESAIYWDTSAVLSVLFRDEHSTRSRRLARSDGAHLVSSLAWAEAHAVMARLERDGSLASPLLDAAREVIRDGPWRRVSISPPWSLTVALAKSWPLRGADLWHLSAAKALRADLPELTMLTFDQRLAAAAEAEGFLHFPT